MMAPATASLIAPVDSSLINAIYEKGVRRAGKAQECGFLPLIPLHLMMKVLGKRVTKEERGYNDIDHKDTNF